MKDEYSISKTVRDAEGVAYDMGFKFVRTLSISELLAMVARNDTADLATGDLRSFRLADLVIETADEDDSATHYIAMEISYTADERDIYREALRNARLLTRFTGHPAHAPPSPVSAITARFRILSTVDRCIGSRPVSFKTPVRGRNNRCWPTHAHHMSVERSHL